jgi:hypothetical protein
VTKPELIQICEKLAAFYRGRKSDPETASTRLRENLNDSKHLMVLAAIVGMSGSGSASGRFDASNHSFLYPENAIPEQLLKCPVPDRFRVIETEWAGQDKTAHQIVAHLRFTRSINVRARRNAVT